MIEQCPRLRGRKKQQTNAVAGGVGQVRIEGKPDPVASRVFVHEHVLVMLVAPSVPF